MERRAFIKGSAGGLAMWAGLATRTEGTSNTQPVKETAPSLTAMKAVQYPGGQLREMTVSDFPAIPNMASSLMDLEPGGLRVLHWHNTAAEIGFVVKGRALLTVIDWNNNAEISTLNAGDIYSVPIGLGHSLACLGTEPCRLVAVYDDGKSVESNAFNATDWIRAEPANILTAILNLPGEHLQQSVSKVSLITKNQPLLTAPTDTHGLVTRSAQSFRFPLTHMPPVTSSGGTFVQASRQDFPMSLTMIASLTILNPRGVREPHWHPNADEWDFVISGRARITMFEGANKKGIVEVGPGDIGYLKRNAAHAVETIGDEPFRLFSVFNADTFQAIGISGLLIATPDEMLMRNLGLSEADISKITKEKKFITSA
jgi:oxalate decarboxylase